MRNHTIVPADKGGYNLYIQKDNGLYEPYCDYGIENFLTEREAFAKMCWLDESFPETFEIKKHDKNTEKEIKKLMGFCIISFVFVSLLTLAMG